MNLKIVGMKVLHGDETASLKNQLYSIALLVPYNGLHTKHIASMLI